MPPIAAAPQRSGTVTRPNPAQDRIGSASALDTAHPKTGEIASASGRSATSRRATGRPTDTHKTSSASAQRRTFRNNGISRT